MGGKDRKIQGLPEANGIREARNLMEKLVMKGKKMAGAPVDLIVKGYGKVC